MEYDTIFAAARRAGNELALVDAGRLSRTVAKAAALLRENGYPGRGILLGRTPDGSQAVMAYFIMGRRAKRSPNGPVPTA